MADDNEARAVTGRPNDIPIREEEQAPLGGNSTFASRAAARGVKAKAVEKGEAEDKAVSRSTTSRKAR
jgi:hypothetical protein